MAAVFLSYSRQDASKAKSLAKALEQAGHQVWWDRHIRSGSEFAGAIEEALKRADAVLVLWSEESVRSSWVRDEAAEGRDSGRLVAAVLDGSRPPIGFRQFQSTDLSGWTGRGLPKQIGELLGAIEEIRPSRQEPEHAAPAKPPMFANRRFGLVAAVTAVVVAALLMAAAGLYWARDSASASETPTLAVLPFADLSPQRDKAYFSEGVAEEILSVLARDPGIRVIGRSSSRQFQDSSSDLQGIRKALGVTHVLEGSARTSGDELRMSVRLIDASDGSQLWAENYQRKMSNIFAVQAEIGQAVARRLSGTLSRQVRVAAAGSTAVDTYALYLAARAKMRERTRPALEQAVQLARRVIAADPNYAPGHAIYAELLWLLSDDNYGDIPIDQVWPVTRRHALQAIKLAPDRPEGYAALGLVPPVESAVKALHKAIELDPSRGELRLWLAAAYGELGSNAEALEQYRAAAAMEPIWAPAIRNLANVLAASRRVEEAERVVQQFERRGGAAGDAAMMRGNNAWLTGDVSEAVRYAEIVWRTQPELLSAMRTYPYLYHDLGFFARAQELSRNEPRLRLYAGGKYSELAQMVRAEGFWSKPNPVVSLDALALTRDWAAIAALYDQRPKPTQQLCGKAGIGSDQAIHFATALKALGRSSEAGQALKCVKERIAKHSRGPIRSFYYPDVFVAGHSANVLAIEGNGAAAFRELGRAVRLGYWTPHSFGMSFLPAFDPYRSTKAYAELDSALKRKMAIERQQALQQGGEGLR